ncbi:tyrosine-type recombinase/integrase [uncultured Phenylobacterium sp.]|uniref:site-specific integrase n=1 Tax=uncultured Phenylobacterium sp. TaxID=349273 RepID=UPI0025ECCA36|nr:tyrosine-type recombinase/integrase [uncultured Phenylobacterium sp.]
MPTDGYTGPRWIKAAGDPPGLVKDGRTGMYYVRRNFSPGPGQIPKQVVRSLRTKSKAEALKRFDIEAGRVRAGIEKVRPKTLKENVAYWQALRATGTTDADVAYDREIERRLGPVLGEVTDELGEVEPAYDPKREAEALEFAGLVNGTRIPVEYLVDDFIGASPVSLRYVSRIKLAVRQLGEFLRGRPAGNNLRAVDRRTASDFIAHLVKTERSVTTAKSKRSALSSYWDWLVTRRDAPENVWSGHKMPRQAGRADVREYTMDEMVALLRGTAEQPMADFIRVGALTGARESEIGALRVRDRVGGWLTIPKGKTEAAKRRLPIHSDLTDLVKRRSAGKRPDDYLFHDLPKSAGKGRGRHEKMGERYTAYRRSVGVVDVREDGRSRVDFHSFRRWFVTEAVRHSGHPEWVVSQIVGHATGKQSMTIGTYFGGSLDEQLVAVVESVRLPRPD